jgi:hypothetical protein
LHLLTNRISVTQANQSLAIYQTKPKQKINTKKKKKYKKEKNRKEKQEGIIAINRVDPIS